MDRASPWVFPWPAQTLVLFPVSSRHSAVRFVFFNLGFWREGAWGDNVLQAWIQKSIVDDQSAIYC